MTDRPTITFSLPDGTGVLRYYEADAVRCELELFKNNSTYNIVCIYRCIDGQWKLSLPETINYSFDLAVSPYDQYGYWKGHNKIRQRRTIKLGKTSRQWVLTQLKITDVANMVSGHTECIEAARINDQYEELSELEYAVDDAQEEVNNIDREIAGDEDDILEFGRQIKEAREGIALARQSIKEQKLQRIKLNQNLKDAEVAVKSFGSLPAIPVLQY